MYTTNFIFNHHYLSLYSIPYHISNVYYKFDMTPPLFSLYGILYYISNIYYKFDMTPPLFCLYHILYYI